AIRRHRKGSAPWCGGPRTPKPGTALISRAAPWRPIRGRTTTSIARPATTRRSRSCHLAPTAGKAAAAVQQTYAAASSKRRRRRAAQRGVILLDLVIAVALLSLLILLVLPGISTR